MLASKENIGLCMQLGGSMSMPHTWVQKKSLYVPCSLIYSHVLYITIYRPIGNFLQNLRFLITQH